MKGLFIPGITAEMFKNGCLEGIETLMAEGEIYDIDYTWWIPVSERLPEVGEYVLVSVHDDYADYNIIINKYEEQAFWSNGRIMAWQPMPAPFKESDSE